jgi:hypothetical protein
VKSTVAFLALVSALVVSVSVASARETYSLTCDATTATVTWPSGTHTVTFVGTDTSGNVGTAAILTLAKSGPGSFTVAGGALPGTIPNFSGTLASVHAVFVTKRGDTGADLTAACA